jgi:RNA polymerase sigma factor (sigma-70 family)
MMDRDLTSGVPPGTRDDDARQIELSLADPDCFGVLFDRYFAEIHGYAARAWLYGIATNHMSAYHRQEERAYRFLHRAGEAPAEDGLADRVVDRVAAGAVRRELAGALADLSRGDRDVLLLIALGGLSHGDVAAALGIPYGTVGSRLNRVRRKLRGLASVALEIGQEDHGNG